MKSIPDGTGFSDLAEAMRELRDQCEPTDGPITETSDENKRLFQLAADHGINPFDYATLAECIEAIHALDVEGEC